MEKNINRKDNLYNILEVFLLRNFTNTNSIIVINNTKNIDAHNEI